MHGSIVLDCREQCCTGPTNGILVGEKDCLVSYMANDRRLRGGSLHHGQNGQPRFMEASRNKGKKEKKAKSGSIPFQITEHPSRVETMAACDTPKVPRAKMKRGEPERGVHDEQGKKRVWVRRQ